MTLKETIGIFVLILVLMVSSLMAFLSWKYADYFLSRREHYINSRYQLFIKKLGWSIGAFFLSLGLILIALEAIFK